MTGKFIRELHSLANYVNITAYSCTFYNVNVAASITTCGRSAISAAVSFFESFFDNNIKFLSLDDVITFLTNVVKESPERKLDDNVLDNNITLADAYYKVMTTCGYTYFPDERDCEIVWDMMSQMSQQDLNRIYYKNNLFKFLENKVIDNMVKTLVCKLEKPFMDPNEVPEEISIELDILLEYLEEFVFYNHQYIDRMNRIEFMPRTVSMIIDTDSCIANFDPVFRYYNEKYSNIDMKIKHTLTPAVEFAKLDEFGDPDWSSVAPIPTFDNRDYDFFNEEIIDDERLSHPDCIIPQDGFRYSIINIIAYCAYKLVNKYMLEYTKNSNSYREDRPCCLVLKNEFLFKSMLVTNVKKNYASIQELQEGNIVPKHKGLDIKGMPMNKSTINKKAQDRMKKILLEDILRAPQISQLQILKRMAILEKDIYNSIVSGSKEYYKPAAIKAEAAYNDPMRISGIKASHAWNTLCGDGYEKINLDERNAVDLVKVQLTKKTVEKLKPYPEVYERAVELLKRPRFNTGINAIAIPTDSSVPDWIFSIINYGEIINKNISTFPLASIGLHLAQGNVNYTNILAI